MKIPLFNSLRFRMPLVVLIGVLPLMLIAILYASGRATKTIRKEAYENMSLKARLLAESVNRWDELNILAVRNLSKQPDIVSMDPNRQNPVLKELLSTYKHFYIAMTTNLDGWNVARSDDRKSVYFGDREWFLGARSGKDLTYQTLIGRTSKRLALCMSTPIRNKETQILGVGVLCTDLEDMLKQVGQLQFGKTGYTFVVDRSGIVLAHPDPIFISGEKLKNLSNYPPVENLLGGKSGDFTFTDEEHIRWVSYSVRLKNGWGIVILQQEAEFFQNEQEFQRLVFFVALIAVLSVSILTWVLANRLIQPISNLTTAASAISNGQLDRKLEIQRKDELGVLAQAFNQMAAQLRNLFEDLERRIEERTAQLKEAKETAEKAREAAEAANQTKDGFLANISHELRTPLNSILGYTKILLRDNKLDDEKVQYLKIVQQSGTHLLTLINDILDFSKTKAGKVELEPTNLELSNFLDEVLDIVEMWAKEKELKLKCELSRNLPTGILADEKRLRQVLINLLSNAIKFTPSGEIILKVKAIDSPQDSGSLTQQKLRFEVQDTGTGINPQELEKIFQPFEQVGTIQSRSSGTGLGLSISKHLVELMGGKIEVKSELDKGSIFWFDLDFPVIEIVEQPQQTLTNEIIGYQGKVRKLLVVDDKEENRQLLYNILKPLGFEVITACDGQEMLKIASSTPLDLIVVDLFMPVKTGFTSIKEIRQDLKLQNIPIIVASATSITEEIRRYLECEAYLSKPIDEQKFLAFLQQLLGLEWVYKEVSLKKSLKLS
jgi:signal transduction histidine kinase/ActR/RegA family two-component response regulator